MAQARTTSPPSVFPLEALVLGPEWLCSCWFVVFSVLRSLGFAVRTCNLPLVPTDRSPGPFPPLDFAISRLPLGVVPQRGLGNPLLISARLLAISGPALTWLSAGGELFARAVSLEQLISWEPFHSAVDCLVVLAPTRGSSTHPLRAAPRPSLLQSPHFLAIPHSRSLHGQRSPNVLAGISGRRLFSPFLHLRSCQKAGWCLKEFQTHY